MTFLIVLGILCGGSNDWGILVKALLFDNELKLIDRPAPEKRRKEAIIRVLMAGMLSLRYTIK